MKKTVDVNLGGYGFIFNQDAYHFLKSYLKDISSRIAEDERETVADIEQRIADILREKLSGFQQVVNTELINYAMAEIGNAEQFGTFKEGKKIMNEDKKIVYETPGRSFYRNTSNSILGGVCAGIAEYYNTDVTIVRLIAVLIALIFGAGIMTYIILWIIMPKKSTFNGYVNGKIKGGTV